MLALLMSGLLLGLPTTRTIELTPRDLIGGLDARKVVVEANGTTLALDPRLWKLGGEQRGVVLTDPIDLGPRSGEFACAASVASVRVKVSAVTPGGATVVAELRSGPNRFSEQGWTPWKLLSCLNSLEEPLAGRYVQVRLTLCGTGAKSSPTVTGLSLQPKSISSPAWNGKLEIVRWDRPTFIQSAIQFHYERPDTPKLARFRRAARLDAIVAGATGDFDKLVRLMDWVGSGQNVRGFAWAQGFDAPYPWDIDRLIELTPDGKLVVKGHCMSYAVALVSAATALGYPARHWAIEGFRDMDHEVAEIWVPDLQKWVYFDPSLTSYYLDSETQRPLNVLELHNLVAQRFLRPGEDMNWWHDEKSEATRARVRQVGGKIAVSCRLGPWNYGDPMPRDYDWGWNHGYLACGFIQMTPRNDFHSHPETASKAFGAAARLTADGYPCWVDDKTPPYQDEHGRASNWYTRPRDFYWTPDASAVELTREEPGGLGVEPGNTMPFFSHYRVRIDEAQAKNVTAKMKWKLHAGRNRLEVIPVDEFGKNGSGNFIVLDYRGCVQ